MDSPNRSAVLLMKCFYYRRICLCPLNLFLFKCVTLGKRHRPLSLRAPLCRHTLAHTGFHGYTVCTHTNTHTLMHAKTCTHKQKLICEPNRYYTTAVKNIWVVKVTTFTTTTMSIFSIMQTGLCLTHTYMLTDTHTHTKVLNMTALTAIMIDRTSICCNAD